MEDNIHKIDCSNAILLDILNILGLTQKVQIFAFEGNGVAVEDISILVLDL